MSRARVREQLAAAVSPLLEPGEQLSGACAVWMADRRDRVPLAFTGRAIYLLAITNLRVFVFDAPRRRRPVLESDCLLQRRHEALAIRGVRTLTPMLQVRLSPAPEREVVLEFRPRDRGVARTLVASVRDAGSPAAA